MSQARKGKRLVAFATGQENIMKAKIQGRIIALALLLGFFPAALAAVTFTITPSAISNTYTGSITLQISGLTSGDTILMQKFLDANTNGVVDAGDLLWQRFQLSDGTNSVFHDGATAVTNFNVPGDTDGAVNGSIASKLYPCQDFAQQIVGKYLFVLSSPLGHFLPLTNSFNVTNFPFAQTITGNVVSNSTAVPNAIVILFQPSGGGQNPRGGVVANNAGAYTIKVPLGAYLLGATKSNFVANLNASPHVSPGAGGTVTTNVPVTNATQSISGKVVDINNPGLGLPALLIPLQSTNNYLAIAFTDTNGNFTGGVATNLWKVQTDDQNIDLYGYVRSQNNTNVNTISGSVSGVTLGLSKATAIFYGTVKDNVGNPLTGVDIYSSDNNGNYEMDGFSYTNGNYIVGALADASDQWQVQVSSDSNPTNYVFTQGPGSVTLTNGQAYQYNFTALPATNLITGQVQDSGGHPLSGIGVNAVNAGGYGAHTDTDSNGNYVMNVANTNTWSVSLNCCNDCGDGLGSNYQCPGSTNVVINNNNGLANFTVYPASSSQIFGYVTDAYGDGVNGVSVYANDGIGDNYSTTTDGSGYYSFSVGNGSWGVSLNCTQLNSFNYQCAGTNSVFVSDYSVEADFSLQFLTTPAFSFTTLYDFSNGSGGAAPYGGLVLSGNTLFGTAANGGLNGAGTVFAVNTNGTGFAVVHSLTAFDVATGTTNTDGANPVDGLVLSGITLYGTAVDGGTNASGTVFKVNTNNTGFAVLHPFTALDAATDTTNSDGAHPYAGLVLSGNTLYGATIDGGTNGNGTVFAVNTNGTGFTVLHTFTAIPGFPFTNSDGAKPYGGLVLSGGTLYGTAAYGGTNGAGTIFKVNTNGAGFAVLHSFNSGSDGSFPQAGLILLSNMLYGTALNGGYGGAGTVFAINTNGTGFTVLHSFFDGGDGGGPNGGLVLSSNTLYGTASYGAASDDGTVFAVSTGGTNFTVLHTFTGGVDGANPYGNLILSANTLYGTASAGGTNGTGTVFALPILPLPSPPQVSKATYFANGRFQLLLNGLAGQNYTLQMSTNLSSTNWLSLYVTNNSTTNSFLVVDPNATNKQRFYRIWMGP